MEAIKINNRDERFEGIEFCLVAIDKKVFNPALTRLAVINGNAVSTNGHHLHQYNDSGLSDGLYEIMSQTKKEIVLGKTDEELTHYPDTDSVWPEGVPQKEIELGDEKTPDCNYSRVVKIMGNDFSLRHSYFEALGKRHYTCQVYDDHKPLVFLNNTVKALIMPMKIN